MSFPPPMNRPPGMGMPPMPPGMPPPAHFGAFNPLPPDQRMRGVISPGVTSHAMLPLAGSPHIVTASGAIRPMTLQAIRPGPPMVAPMGMVPGAPTLLPRPAMPVMPVKPVQQPQQIDKKEADKKEEKPKESDGEEEEGEALPSTTVFVGNITDRATDVLIRQMLMKCGTVLSWKRVQGATGKLQGTTKSFGFCEYAEPESTLRALRLLHDWQLGDKKLLVKVDAKTRAVLDEYMGKKKAAKGNSGDKDTDELDEETIRQDNFAMEQLEQLKREHNTELNTPIPDDRPSKGKKEGLLGDKPKAKQKKEDKKEEAIDDLEDMEVDEEKRNLITKEIRSFREAHKNDEEKEKERDKERKEREREREKERERREREREKEREREREREREEERRRKEREREREKERERESSSRRERERMDREREYDRERRERDREKEREEEEEAYERRKLERKLREKELAYQERLKAWETRERRKTREYDKENEREEDRKKEMIKEAKRLKEFLEDYDDERDDPKYYKYLYRGLGLLKQRAVWSDNCVRGSALQKRLKERQKEIELDEMDRRKEKEEIEEIRRRLMEEGHPDPQAEVERLERETEKHKEPQLKTEPPEPSPRETKPHLEPTLKPAFPPIQVKAAPSVSSQDSPMAASGGESPAGIIFPSAPKPDSPPDESSQDSFAPVQGPEPPPANQKPKIGFGLKFVAAPATSSPAQAPPKRKIPIGQVFSNDDEDGTDDGPKKRKLIPIEYTEEEKMAVSHVPTAMSSTEEKRKSIKNLIEKIPTAKDELFAYSLDWSQVDQGLMEKRVKPWINKKIVEYIGEEEPTLTEFICQKVMAHSVPKSILEDVAMVLDEEAEVFVVKMWRLLIYETEAKKHGLVK
ncbi:RNA-binding protein 25-like isoform X2 [Branchiostoma floridae]|uniref:RNA-binding protein 25-like isoform X2 n=1 Tax=Branchiostoma floridae TaxID=7739 RepID=A0A9J7LT86_BRAFL|nr:RNA-binding protein 25-like isoform X2 [Branchiostoma floridae]